jgi:hypothetical protein
LHNVSNRPQSASPEVWSNLQRLAPSYRDLLTGHDLDLTQDFTPEPFQVLWLVPNPT